MSPTSQYRPAVGAERHARDAVSAECRMHVVALADGDPRVDEAVAVRVAEPPERGSRSDEQIAVVMEHPPAMSEVGSALKPSIMIREQVRAAVSIGILNAIQALLDLRKVTPVARAVLVVVGQPGIRRRSAPAQARADRSQQVLHRPQRVHRRDP